MTERRLNIAIYYSGRIQQSPHVYNITKGRILEIAAKHNVTHFVSLNRKANTDPFIDMFKNHFDIKPDQINIEETILPSEVTQQKIRVSGNLYNMFSMFYHNMKCFRLIETYQKEHNITFDIIVKYRPDIYSNQCLDFPSEIENNTVYIPRGADWGGINDQIGFGNFDTMKKYSQCVLQFSELGKQTQNFHPETLLKAHLQNKELNIKRFDFEYSLRKN